MDLRARTGLGVMECKRALGESDNDVERAIEYLRRESKLKSAKKSARVATEGVVLSGTDEAGGYGVIFELNSETDFVARDENFLSYAKELMASALRSRPRDAGEMMDADMEGARQRLIQMVGENIELRRMQFMESDGGGLVCYTHNNRRVASLVDISDASADLARDIAMHVAAMAPLVLRIDDVPDELVEKERAIYMAQAERDDKPAQVVEKMVAGKIAKYKAECSLLAQSFVKDPKLKVEQLLAGEKARVSQFVRYELGEGADKSEVDFAAEVAAQVAQHRA